MLAPPKQWVHFAPLYPGATIIQLHDSHSPYTRAAQRVPDRKVTILASRLAPLEFFGHIRRKCHDFCPLLIVPEVRFRLTTGQ